MNREIPERDWKVWRALRDEALQRFCQESLDELESFARGEGTAHERYLEMYTRMQKRDDELAEIFNSPRRSVAYMQIALAVRKRAVKKSDLSRFTEETQQVLSLMLGK